MSVLLTVPEVAQHLRVSTRTVERLISSGRLRVVRPSPRTVFVEERELEAYLASRRGRNVA